MRPHRATVTSRTDALRRRMKKWWRVVAFLIAGTLLAPACLDWLDDRPFSEKTALELVANELCPQAPDQVMDELLATLDSGKWSVYVRASDNITGVRHIRSREDTKAHFAVGEDLLHPGEVDFGPWDERSEIFLEVTRGRCAAGRPPFP